MSRRTVLHLGMGMAAALVGGGGRRDRMIPGHPYAGGRLGTRDDVKNLKQYMTELSDVVRQAADQGKCFDQAMKEIKLPQYEKWGGYEPFLPGNIQRFCEFWGRGF